MNNGLWSCSGCKSNITIGDSYCSKCGSMLNKSNIVESKIVEIKINPHFLIFNNEVFINKCKDDGVKVSYIEDDEQKFFEFVLE